MVIIIMIIIKTHSHCYILVKLYLGVLKQELVYVLMEISIEPCVCYCKLYLLDTQGRGVACRRLITTSSADQIVALRSIDLQTRSTDLDVFVYIATDKTPLLCPNPAAESHHPTRDGTDRRRRDPPQGHSYDDPLRHPHRC